MEKSKFQYELLKYMIPTYQLSLHRVVRFDHYIHSPLVMEAAQCPTFATMRNPTMNQLSRHIIIVRMRRLVLAQTIARVPMIFTTLKSQQFQDTALVTHSIQSRFHYERQR